MNPFSRLVVTGALVSLALACNQKEEPKSTALSAAASASSRSEVSILKEGDLAPDIEMTLQDGRRQKLSALRGQMVVVYFYPKDETPGCTVEAEDFRDRFADLKNAGIAVIGVSTQDAASHKAFIDKEKLPFDLAVDTDKAIATAFGVASGRMGLHARQTFLIGKDGTIKKVWRDVTPKDHATQVLRAAQS